MKKQNHFDWVLLLTIIILIVFGLFMVFSSSYVVASNSSIYNYDAFYFLKKQVIWIFIGLFIMFIIYKIELSLWYKLSPYIFFLSIISLILVLLPHFGVSGGGSKRWLALGPFLFQPSEFAKIALVLYLSYFFSKNKEKIKSFRFGVFKSLILFALMAGLIELEPDLSTGFLMGIVFLVLLYAAGAENKYILMLIGGGLFLFVVLIFRESYRLKRIFAFVNPWKDPLNTGYHTIQSLIGFALGGIWGVGLGQSRQKMFFLPEQHTDYIFSIIGEELGFIGVSLVIFLYVIVFYRGIKIALSAGNMFETLVALGSTFMIVLQAGVNMAVALGLFPSTGVTLPFISFGGSSIVVSFIFVGFLLNISKRIKKEVVVEMIDYDL